MSPVDMIISIEIFFYQYAREKRNADMKSFEKLRWRNALDKWHINRGLYSFESPINHVLIWITFLIEFNMKI